MKDKYLKILIYLGLVGVLFGCGENQSNETTGHPALGQTDFMETPVKDQDISGLVRDTTFKIEQARFLGRTLEMRQGSDFFADVSVKITFFNDTEKFEGKTLRSLETGSFSHHIWLGVKKEGENLPDEIPLASDYDLVLSFGAREELGIPFSIRLASLKTGTSIEGRSFATFRDIKVVNDNLDLKYDSFDTLEFLAVKYIKNLDVQFKLGKKFGGGYAGYGGNYPKSGFVGYEATTGSGVESLIKVQLAKDENGWRVANLLNSNQIHQAHPVFDEYSGSLRTVENAKADLLAGKRLEAYLVEQKLIENVRSTSVRCYLTAKADRASCRAVFGLMGEDGIKCHNQNYLLSKNKNNWKYESQLLETQQVDYNSGELVTKKAFQMSCQ